jgi:radical SAM superfamily enzyme YgiQ (UPF0313 family)
LPLKERPFLLVAPQRGCPYRCSFCTAPLYYGSKLRRRPIPAVIAEIEDNIAAHGVREFLVWADTFTADTRYVREFSAALASRRLGVSWSCNSRVDTVDAESLAAMKAAGLWMISFGLESASDEILQAAGKEITAAQSRRAVALAKAAGLSVTGHFIFGLPGETKATMAATLALALELPLDVAQFYAAVPFPGTALHEEARRNGWLRPGANASQQLSTMDLPGLPAARVDAYRRLAYRRFFLRPRARLRLLGLLEWRGMTGILPDLRRFLRWAG